MKRNYDYQENLDAEVLVFEDKYLSHVQGKVLTLLEALGHIRPMCSANYSTKQLDIDTQSEAIKSLVREAIWGDMHNGWCNPTTKEKFEALLD